jgi:hypothetical protein
MPELASTFMKNPDANRAIISLGFSAAPSILSIWTFYLYFFCSDSKEASEDCLEYGLFSLWMIPLLISGIVMGASAYGFRLICIGFGLVSILCWTCIIVADTH